MGQGHRCCLGEAENPSPDLASAERDVVGNLMRSKSTWTCSDPV
jgi:hypothetical protein